MALRSGGAAPAIRGGTDLLEAAAAGGNASAGVNSLAGFTYLSAARRPDSPVAAGGRCGSGPSGADAGG
jgi:hypothetical protein